MIDVRHGDCRDVLREIADASIDACVTDPPYALVSITKRFANTDPAYRSKTTAKQYHRLQKGFMGKEWDNGEVAFAPEFWAEVWRVLKPGAHLIAFGGTRTYHRMACAIEDAGFEIRDQIGWLYGSGFPKSHNVGNGWGTALKPAWEPIVLARKPLIGTVAANVQAHGTGALNVDGCRVEGEKPQVTQGINGNATSFCVAKERRTSGDPHEGRWPANVIHDGSDQVLAAFAAYGERDAGGTPERRISPKTAGIYGEFKHDQMPEGIGGSTGFAARFFYSAKADAGDRLGSKHPTVKPVDLMAYLCRLVTPPGGTVLDPFAGSGTTGMACLREGFNAILIEREAEYVADIHRRLKHVKGEDTPLFAQVAE
jgi:site-specific DNA-methyltransferase (adenine-specific)